MDQSILRRLTGKPVPRRFAVVDMEARRWVEPYAVGFYDGKNYREFIDYSFSYKAVDQFLRFVLQPSYTGWWIYAHNGGNYDFTFLFRHIIMTPDLRSKYHVEITPVGSTVVRFDVIAKGANHKDGCVGKGCKGCSVARDENQQKRWVFIDSARLMPLPLKDVCLTLGGTKKVELQKSYDELALPENNDEMRHYLKVDCVALHQAIGKMQTIINGLGGQLGVTLPATALDVFRRRFQRDDIYTNRHWLKCPEYGKRRSKGEAPECRSCLHDFIREAYFGGRTEIFRSAFVSQQWIDDAAKKLQSPEIPDDERKQLKETLAGVRQSIANGLEVSPDVALMYDINSHYPNCMLEPMPIGAAIEMEGLSEDDVYENARRMMGIVECDVWIPEDTYLPPLPMRVKEGRDGKLVPTKSSDGKLVFPVGRLSGVWDTAELVLLRKVGGKILKTRRSVWFGTAPVFARYIRQLYKFRDKRLPDWNKGMDWIAKILMNSAYGKFAMKEDRQKILIHPESPEGLKCLNFEADVWTEDTIVSPTYIVPQLSVHVTAIARARLWEILTKVVADGGRVYYTDTDSVVCSGANLPTASDLGALKLEAKITRGQFVLPKLYLVETTEPKRKDPAGKPTKKKEASLAIKAKGMGPGIRMSEEGDDPYAGELSEQEFMDMVKRGVPIERHRMQKLREALREYARSATQFPRIIASPKQIQSEYDKRTVLDDYDTVPKTVDMF